MSFLLTIIFLSLIFGIFHWFKFSSTSSGKVLKIKHDFFSRLWLWPRNEHTRWEAEFDTPSKFARKRVGLHAEDNYELEQAAKPSENELAFCTKFLLNLEHLFLPAKSGLAEGWRQLFREELPEKWMTEFCVEGFSVPRNGDFNDKWAITFYCLKADRFFIVEVKQGIAILATIDG